MVAISSINHPAPTTVDGGSYAIHRATGPIFILHAAFEAPGRAARAVAGWRPRSTVFHATFITAVLVLEGVALAALLVLP